MYSSGYMAIRNHPRVPCADAPHVPEAACGYKICLRETPRTETTVPQFTKRVAPAISRFGFITLRLLYLIVHRSLGLEYLVHFLQPSCEPLALMGKFGGATSQIGNPQHLFVVERPSAARARSDVAHVFSIIVLRPSSVSRRRPFQRSWARDFPLPLAVVPAAPVP